MKRFERPGDRPGSRSLGWLILFLLGTSWACIESEVPIGDTTMEVNDLADQGGVENDGTFVEDTGTHTEDLPSQEPDTGVDACLDDCDVSQCMECVDGMCISACRSDEVCEAAQCAPYDICANIPSLEDATQGQVQRSADVILPRNPGEESRDGFEFASVFQRRFPGRQVQQRFKLDVGFYAAMRFTSPSDLEPGHQGAFTAEAMPGTGNGLRLISISECQGNFDAASLDPRCLRQVQGVEGILWSVDPDNPVRCPLRPDTEYYLNIVFTEEAPGVAPEDLTWSCPGQQFGRCGFLFSPGHNYVTPECGAHATVFEAQVQDWPPLEEGEIGFCVGRGPQPDPLPTFPSSGETVQWRCELPPEAVYGRAPTCSASRR